MGTAALPSATWTSRTAVSSAAWSSVCHWAVLLVCCNPPELASSIGKEWNEEAGPGLVSK
eukprot:SAG22_NODE_1844_length_3454_cov_2.054844_4_plen_60_part_00